MSGKLGPRKFASSSVTDAHPFGEDKMDRMNRTGYMEEGKIDARSYVTSEDIHLAKSATLEVKIEEIEKALDMLGETVSTMEGRLNCVLSPDYHENTPQKDEGHPMSMLSPLSITLERQAERIREDSQRLMKLLENMEI